MGAVEWVVGGLVGGVELDLGLEEPPTSCLDNSIALRRSSSSSLARRVACTST